jgi:ribonuclease P protein component
LNRKYRITSTNEFQRVRHSGRSYAHPLLVVITLASQNEDSHCGIITGKIIGNAVKRNKARRRIRSILDKHLINFKQPHDIVVIARTPISQANFTEIEEALSGVLQKAGIISK